VDGGYWGRHASRLARGGCARRPERRRRTDKSDLIDAEAAGRRLLTGKRLPLPRGGGERELLRLLLLEPRSAQHGPQQASNQLQAAIITLDPPLRARLARRRPSALARSSVLRDDAELAPLRRLAKRIVLLEQELAEIDRELAQLTRRLCPRLLAEHGIGPLCAAQVLVSATDPNRLRSEPAFAALAGVSPIEASSGPLKRHRLNRGGDRQLNWALHMSALNRIRYHPETRSYYQRLLDRGKTKREAIRIAKRALARRLHRALTTTPAT
jgi:transposase